jgi:putative flavoprotein involved in K+ transport
MPGSGVVAYLENYAEQFDLPVRYRTVVERVDRNPKSGSYLVRTADGGSIFAQNVIIATGLHQRPKVPAFSSALPSHIRQAHSDSYRNPEELSGQAEN